MIRFRFVAFLPLIAPALCLAQFSRRPLPPVPQDPLEIVTSDAQPVQNADQRAAAAAVLIKAHDLSNVRAQPYDLKTTFASSGSLPSDGSWVLEDISPGHGIYRWTAQGPGYSAVNLYTNTTRGMLYTNQPSGAMPLRLTQVRGAVFFNAPAIGPQVSMRTATGSFNGATLNCVLTSFQRQPYSGGRNWRESEFCVDSNTGLLTTYSPVPGLYIHYDYASAPTFHGKTIPAGFTITEAGKTVIEAKTESVADPPDSTNPLFAAAGLTPLGVGQVMTAPVHWIGAFHAPGSNGGSNSTAQMVVLHGSLSPDNHVSETEILASTDPGLNLTALERANSHKGFSNEAQPGTTPRSREILFVYEFETSGP